MRVVFWLLAFVALAAANAWEEPWVEEEDLAEYTDAEDDETAEAEPRLRARRDVYVEEPYEEHVRVKRRCCEEEPYEMYRVKRSPEYSRVPRQIHQYEVFESTDDSSASMQSPPYEEMLAASAEHYHRVYAAPGVPVSTGNLKNSASASYGSVKGVDTAHHTDKGSKGHKTDEHHKKEYEEATGKKNKHHDKADHKGGHEEEAHGHRGAHFDEKKGHKKGHKTKGYHNKYHKDEFHKEHKFYDDFHKSGEHHRYGKFNAKHASNESGKKKAHHVNAGHDFVERGKKGYSNKGHLDADHKGYKGKQGHEEHHEHHKNHGKKGGSEGGKEWGYSKKN